MNRQHILIVDEDGARSAGIARVLRAAGYRTTERDNSLDGLMTAEEDPAALLIVDWDLTFVSGPILVSALRAGLPEPPPVLAVIPAGIDADAVLRAGAATYLHSPIDHEQLLARVRAIIGDARVQKGNHPVREPGQTAP